MTSQLLEICGNKKIAWEENNQPLPKLSLKASNKDDKQDAAQSQRKGGLYSPAWGRAGKRIPPNLNEHLCYGI